MMKYNKENYSVEIKVMPNTTESWCFVCNDFKLGKEYEQIYTLIELKEKFKIFTIYPTMFERLIEAKKPEVDINNGFYLKWVFQNPFGDEEIIILNIKEKSMTVSNEILELNEELSTFKSYF
jgi:hypothetical protein